MRNPCRRCPTWPTQPGVKKSICGISAVFFSNLRIDRPEMESTLIEDAAVAAVSPRLCLPPVSAAPPSRPALPAVARASAGAAASAIPSGAAASAFAARSGAPAAPGSAARSSSAFAGASARPLPPPPSAPAPPVLARRRCRPHLPIRRVRRRRRRRSPMHRRPRRADRRNVGSQRAAGIATAAVDARWHHLRRRPRSCRGDRLAVRRRKRARG